MKAQRTASKTARRPTPLKARAVSAYQAKLRAWFDARFRPPDPPEDKAACEELRKLGASVSVSVSGDRTVGGYSIGSPSGNAAFDERVHAMLDAARGETLPPPPPLYPDILGQSLPLRLSGRNQMRMKSLTCSVRLRRCAWQPRPPQIGGCSAR